MRPRITLAAIVVVISSLAFGGCFIGSYVSDKYRDFSAYFNTYYNASIAYNAALKDVANSKKEYDINSISGTATTPFTISTTARQNFDLAIQEASKVLQFYPKSEFTEDCLYLIGISYYYEGNTMGGERKFAEAEVAFPKSHRIPEAEMYMGGLELEGQQAHQGESRLFNSRILAGKDKNRKVLSKSADILADYYETKGDTNTAVAYLDSAAVTSDDDNAAIYYCREGNLLTAVSDYQAAVSAYEKGWKCAKDIRLRFYSRYYMARALRDEHKYYAALANVRDLRKDDKYFNYFPLLDYQRAQVLCDSGEVSTAVTEFQKIDTVAATNEASTRSAYELGKIYLYKVGDYQTALKFYQKCTSHPAVYGITTKAQQMAASLQEYFITSYKVALSDSMYYAALHADSTDSSKAMASANLDSLYEHAAYARHELAGFFLFRLQIPDSAVHSYKIVVKHFPRSNVCPSALYTLGEYLYSSGDSSTGKRYLDTLISKYPKSAYSTSACSLLGIERVVPVDSTQMMYDSALRMINKDSLDSAVVSLKSLLGSGKSSILPQTLYTLGWVYENRLQLSDSAYVYYNKLAKAYPSSNYSSSITLALTGYEEAKRDSMQTAMKARDSVQSLRNKLDTAKEATHQFTPNIGKANVMPDSLSVKRQAEADSLENRKKFKR